MLLHIIRTNAPAHILDQLEDFLGEEEEEEPKKSIRPEANTQAAEPPQGKEESEDEEK
jgi:hypothetical protein